jgi:peroxiredoxin
MVATTAPSALLDFRLVDCHGEYFDFADDLSGVPVIVIFYRGHWCPYCRRYLAKVQLHLPRLTEHGAQVIAISPEPPATTAALVKALSISFPLLSDTDGSVIDRFGVRNRFTSASTHVPHPAVFVFDSARHLRFSSIDRNYKKRTTIRTLVSVLQEIQASSLPQNFSPALALSH